jgi:predicted amidohydrolase
VETEFGVLGIMLGWDLVFPEVARNLVLDGAEVLLMPAAWEARNVAIWRNLLVSRAYENEVFVAASNRIGQEPSYAFAGESAVLSPSGELLGTIAAPEEGEEEGPVEGYVVARLDLDEIRRRREESQIMLARQPAAYRSIVRKY